MTYDKVKSRHVGRFAPSPTGRMHLGNVFTALVSWLSARSRGGDWILRIEDLDPQRSRREYAEAIEDDLYWLGLRGWLGGLDDRGPAGPYSQSRRGHIYEQHLQTLISRGLVYPCHCTRADLHASQAPHAADGTIIYSGRCRPSAPPPFAFTPGDFTHAAARIVVPDHEIAFRDGLSGMHTSVLSRDCGDFVLRRADGAWAYQLAVTVDDALMGVTEVIRGNDLTDSTPRQLYLYKCLGYSAPAFTHLPLLTDLSGRRLSKRDADLDMGALRRRYTPECLLGRLAHLAGLAPTPAPVTAEALALTFTLAPMAGLRNIPLPLDL